MFSDIDIRRIKDSASIKEVMEEFGLHLKKEGPNYTCLCPFHSDRHLGSFKVNMQRNMYHCFSCGASGGPVDFLMDYAGYTFPDAIRYLGAKYGIRIEGSENYHPKPCKPHEHEYVPPLPTLALPASYMLATRDLSNDNLCKWIKSLPWNEEQRKRIDKTLTNYLVGHTRPNKEEEGKDEIRRSDNFTIFWQADEIGIIRTGKMLKYKTDGHKMKSEDKKDFTNDYISARMSREYEKRPEWFVNRFGYNPNEYEMRQTLFGMHLVDYFPTATINLVESEKTALICAIYFGNQDEDLWMATGGMANLKPDTLKPLLERKRKIMLYPDIDGIKKWQSAAEAFDSKLMKIQSGFMKKYWKPEDGPKADIADIIVRMLEETRSGKVQRVGDIIKQMILTNPFLENLIDKFQLTPIIPA